MYLNNIPPFWGWTWSSPAVNSLYYDVVTDEERVFNLCKNFQRLIDYSNEISSAVNELSTQIDDELADAVDEIEDLFNSFKSEIMAIIAGIAEGSLQWDVQLGNYQSTVTAQRDMFNDVTLHALTVDALAESEYTVDTLAECGLNVRGVAVYSGSLIQNFSPLGVFYTEPTPGGDTLLTTQQLATALVNASGYFLANNGEEGEELTSTTLASAVVDSENFIKEERN